MPSGGESSWFAELSSEESGENENEGNRSDSDDEDDVEVVKTVTIEDRVVERIGK